VRLSQLSMVGWGLPEQVLNLVYLLRFLWSTHCQDRFYFNSLPILLDEAPKITKNDRSVNHYLSSFISALVYKSDGTETCQIGRRCSSGRKRGRLQSRINRRSKVILGKTLRVGEVPCRQNWRLELFAGW
jgi:hypothetical protein